MKHLMMMALGLAAGVAWATQSVYDDLGVPQSCRDDTAFWTLTGHAGPTVDTDPSDPADLDAMVPVAVSAAQPLAIFDSRWRLSCESEPSPLSMTAPGFLLFLR